MSKKSSDDLHSYRKNIIVWLLQITFLEHDKIELIYENV